MLGAAACGGSDGNEARPAEPRLPRALAADLAARSDRVADSLAAGDDCGAATQAEALRTAVLAAINERRVPPELQEELSGAANGLVSRVECAPAATPPPPPPPPPTEPATTAEDREEDEDEEPVEPESEEGGDEQAPADTDILPPVTVDETVPTVTDVPTTTGITTTEGG